MSVLKNSKIGTKLSTLMITASIACILLSIIGVISLKKTGDASTSDENDWVKMDASQKSNNVSAVLSSLKSKGYTISGDTGWFIDALNAFYGENETNSTKVTEAH